MEEVKIAKYFVGAKIVELSVGEYGGVSLVVEKDGKQYTLDHTQYEDGDISLKLKERVVTFKEL